MGNEFMNDEIEFDALQFADLVIPAEFEECMSYEEQIMFLNLMKQAKLQAGDNISLRKNDNGTVTISATITGGQDGRGIKSIVGNVTDTGTNVVVTLTDNTTQTFFVQRGQQGIPGVQGPAGERGSDGSDGSDGFSPLASVTPVSDGAIIEITDVNGTTQATVLNGSDGSDGVTPNITANATVDNQTGTPQVQVTKTGTDTAPTYTFAFSGIKGEQGPQGVPGSGDDGVGISDISLYSSSSAGNTYKITLSNQQEYFFTAPSGPAGQTGPSGATGSTGPAGQDGFSPLASVTPVSNGAMIEITDVNGTTQATVLNGTNGTNGSNGVGISNITFKETDANGNNVYTITLDNSNTYDVTCPIGPTGAAGSTGATGPAGPGVPDGGSTGQVLVKRSWADYDTEWQTPSGGAVTVTPATNYGREVGSITSDGVTQNLYAGLPYADNREVINIYTNETQLGENMQVTDISCYIPDTAYGVPVQLTVWSSNNEVIFVCDMEVNIYYYDTDIAIMPSNAVAVATYPSGEYIIKIPQFTSTSGVWDTTNRLSIKPLATGGGSTSAKSIKVTSGYFTSATVNGGSNRHMSRPSSWGGSLSSVEGVLGFEIVEVNTDNGVVYQFVPLTNIFEYLYIKWSGDVGGDYMNVTIPSSALTIDDNLFTNDGTISAYTSFGGWGIISNNSKTFSGLVKVNITKSSNSYTLTFNFYGILGVSTSGAEYIF